MTSRIASLTEQDIEKIVEDKDLQNTKKVDEGGKGAVCWLREREKSERNWGIFTILEINDQFHLLSWPFFSLQCIIKQLLDSGF